MKILSKVKEFFFPTITPPVIGEQYRQIERDWVDVENHATIIEVTNVSKDGKHIKYEWVRIEGKPCVQTFAGSTSSSSTYEMATHHLYRMFEKVK